MKIWLLEQHGREIGPDFEEEAGETSTIAPALLKAVKGVPDTKKPSRINYWVPVRWVPDGLYDRIYLEGWSDECLAGTGFLSIEEGGWDEKIDYIKDLTPGILFTKERERDLELIAGGFIEFEDEDYYSHLYGVTYGFYKSREMTKDHRR